METTTYYQPLFDYMSNQHGLHLLESDMSEIINIVKQMKNKERIAILESEISRLKVANRNNIYRIEAIESYLAEQHKGANFSKLNSSGIPNSCLNIKPEAPACVADLTQPKTKAEKDYTHLLPDGYEFCSEEDAEKWVKVEMKNIHDNDEFRVGSVRGVNIYKGTWLPIRPIQYKVTTHEITTAIPDPYMPDWSKAPEGTVAHAWDRNGMGYWYIRRAGNTQWEGWHISSNLTLPADLDWMQSLRVKPSK